MRKQQEKEQLKQLEQLEEEEQFEEEEKEQQLEKKQQLLIYCHDRCLKEHDMCDKEMYCHKMLIRKVKATYDNILSYKKHYQVFMNKTWNTLCGNALKEYKEQVKPFFFPKEKCDESMYFQMIFHWQNIHCTCRSWQEMEKQLCDCQCTTCNSYPCQCKEYCTCDGCDNNRMWDIHENYHVIPKVIKKLHKKQSRCHGCKKRYYKLSKHHPKHHQFYLNNNLNNSVHWTENRCVECVYLNGRKYPQTLYNENEEQIKQERELMREKEKRERQEREKQREEHFERIRVEREKQKEREEQWERERVVREERERVEREEWEKQKKKERREQEEQLKKERKKKSLAFKKPSQTQRRKKK